MRRFRWPGKLRRRRGVSFDAVMCLAVHIDNIQDLVPRVPLDPHPNSLDTRWQADEATEFLAAAREFVRVSSFTEFSAAHQPLYELSQQRLQKVLDQDAHLQWFGDFFVVRPQARFHVLIGLLNGGNCYGPRVRLPDGAEELYCVLGAWSPDKQGDPQFDKSMLSTVIHEFCHSYANAVIDAHADQLEPAGTALYEHVSDAMRRQAYGNWKTMMYESLVRACTIRYARQHQSPADARRQAANDRSRQFLWIDELETLLGQYEQNREQFPTLDQFAPQIVAFFNSYSQQFVAKQAEVDAQRPQIVTMMPTNGATDVDPALTELKVVFDRPMQDGAWSLVGRGPNFPEITGKPSYDDTRKIWSVAIKLKPNWSYKCMLNSDRFTSFRSEQGVPLKPVSVTFQTGAKRVP